MAHRATILLLTGAALLTAAPFPHSSPKLAGTYTTNFPNTENPISGDGNWTNGKTDGVDWFDVETTPGKAFGNETVGEYTDPTAILKSSWGPDQTVTAMVFCTKPTASYYQEVEIRLRSTMSAHSCTGYEILWRCLTNSNAYAQVVRWNGPVGNFTYIDNSHNFGFTSYTAVDTEISSQSHFPVRTDDSTINLASLGRGWDGLWLTLGFIRHTFTNAKQGGNEFVRVGG